jgi:hypothetical protein
MQPGIAQDDADHRAAVAGVNYIEFLRHLHKHIAPNTYFEIGSMAGNSLVVANCSSIAVDPAFVISQPIVGSKPMCLLYRETSDEFFARHNPTDLFGRPIDLAFLDGMHKFDFLLRDFINTERHCDAGSTIVMHDCLPPGFYMTAPDIADPIRFRSRFENYWTGDVWRIVPILQKYRPDLSLRILDCPPTGLVLVSNLNPSDNTLSKAYSEIVEESSLAGMDRAAYDAYWRSVSIEQSTDHPAMKRKI